MAIDARSGSVLRRRAEEFRATRWRPRRARGQAIVQPANQHVRRRGWRLRSAPVPRARIAGVAALVVATLGGAVVPASVAGGTTTRASSPCGSLSFYRPPAPLPNEPHGSVVRWRTGCDYLLPGVAAPAKAWNVLYLSTDANDHPIAVSGTVLVPNAPWTGDG